MLYMLLHARLTREGKLSSYAQFLRVDVAPYSERIREAVLAAVELHSPLIPAIPVSVWAERLTGLYNSSADDNILATALGWARQVVEDGVHDLTSRYLSEEATPHLRRLFANAVYTGVVGPTLRAPAQKRAEHICADLHAALMQRVTAGHVEDLPAARLDMQRLLDQAIRDHQP